jgi:ubiquinone/menaquinone biosynthesis C-methylase UbiE
MKNRMRESLTLWASLFISRCDVTPNSLVLDLGCGDGAFLRQVVRSVGCAALGVDLHPARPASGVWVVRGDVCRLPLRDATVNAAFASNLLHHLSEPALCLLEVARVLVDGGVICLRLASHAQIRAQLISSLFPEAAQAACARTPDLPSVVEALRSAGLAVFAVEEVEEPATQTAGELLERLRAGMLPAPVTGQALEAAVRHLEGIAARGGADAEPKGHLTLVAARKVTLDR